MTDGQLCKATWGVGTVVALALLASQGSVVGVSSSTAFESYYIGVPHVMLRYDTRGMIYYKESGPYIEPGGLRAIYPGGLLLNVAFAASSIVMAGLVTESICRRRYSLRALLHMLVLTSVLLGSACFPLPV